MKFKQFKKNSIRDDILANDNVHFFARHFSKRIAYFCYILGFSPNGITWLFLFVGILASLMFYQGLPILGYFFWRLHIILDMADGDAARATKIFSQNAVGFDRSNHIIINSSVIFAFSYMGIEYYLINSLLVTFYLYYFFSRNFFTEKTSTQYFSITKNIIKNIIGFEGFILSGCIAIYFNSLYLMTLIFIFYSFSFFLLFILKIRYMIAAKYD